MIPLVAHRGHASEFPENTLPALRSAISLGLRFIEFDVHLSRDEVPVIIHDNTLSRTGDRPDSVFDLTAAQLTATEVNERSRLGERFHDVHIPLLSDAVKLLTEQPLVTAFVEIKRASLRQFGTEKVVNKILEVIQPVKQQCVVISFDFAAVHMAHRLGFKVGWVLVNYDAEARAQCESLKPEFLFCDHEKLPPDGSRLWPGPWRWAIYEVEDAKLARQLTARGADLIETMAGGAMVEALRDLV